MGAFSLGKPMWNSVRRFDCFRNRKEIDIPHWRKANPSACDFKSISARCAIAVSVVSVGDRSAVIRLVVVDAYQAEAVRAVRVRAPIVVCLAQPDIPVIGQSLSRPAERSQAALAAAGVRWI
jgi:hypothetical protein